jgi:hypothetical protein
MDAGTSSSQLRARNLLGKLVRAILSAPEKSENNLKRLHIEPCIDRLKVFAEVIENPRNRCGRLTVNLDKDFAAILLIARPPYKAAHFEAIDQTGNRSRRQAGVVGYFTSRRSPEPVEKTKRLKVGSRQIETLCDCAVQHNGRIAMAAARFGKVFQELRTIP